jgi:integrase
LDNDEEEALVVAVNATGMLQETIITFLLYTGLRAQERCSLTHQQVHLGKRHEMWRIRGNRKNVREVPLTPTARSILMQYLGTLPQECQSLFPSKKTQRARTGRRLEYLVTKYATQAQIAAISPYDLRYRFGYRMAEVVPLHRLVQIMGADSLDPTRLFIRGTKQDLQQNVEKTTWI